MENEMESAAQDMITARLCIHDNDDDLVFFSSIDEPTKEWLNSLNHVWGLWKRCDGVTQTLTEYFVTAPNPYLSTLRIIVNTSDFKHMKQNSSLAFAVIEEFAKWLETQNDKFKNSLAVDLKVAAFRLVTKQSNMQFTKLVAYVYEFTEHKEEFVNLIKKKIERKEYKEAAQYATMLQLQHYFPCVETLLLPLILQNKLSIVENFLADNPEMQKSLIAYLDNLISSEENMCSKLNEVILQYDISNTNISMQMKPMTKLIGRYVKLYNLPPELCPNLNKKRSAGALQFLIHKRYVQGDLSTASWREMAQEAVGNDTKLQLEMIRMLINTKDAREALHWAREFRIPKEQWPWAVSYEAEHESERVNEGASSSRAETNDSDVSENSMNCHELMLPRNAIKVVNNKQSFYEFLDIGLNDVSVVGIDSEWKPSFGKKQTELALIQIATKTNVYILDVTTMGNDVMELWNELAIVLFENKNILKLGFGIAQDMTVIQSSLPALSKVKTYGEGYLDIVLLWKKLVSDYEFVFPYEGDQRFTKNNLSKLVEITLGQKLDKSDQFSNWEQRPLRESQIIYAALDAFCLLEIYSVIELQCDQLGIPFYDICLELQHSPLKTPKRNTKKFMEKPHQFENEKSNYNIQQNVQRYRSQNVNTHSPKRRYPQKQKHMDESQDLNYPQRSNRSEVFRKMHPMRPSHLNKTENVQAKCEKQEYQLSLTNERRIPVHSWRVVCDAVLGGLTNQLRICGCDCTHIVCDQGGYRSVKVAVEENRVFLTRNRAYLKFSQHLPPGRCYFVLSNTPEDQLREVLTNYGVVVTNRDIFSRCRSCNNDEFVKVTKNVMDKLKISFVKCTRERNHSVLSSSFVEDLIRETHNSQASTIQMNSEDDAINHVENENRTWTLSTNSINVDTCSTKYHTRIQLDKVPINVFKVIKVFYVCEHCGKVYWNGPYLDYARNAFKDFMVHV